MAFSKKMQDIFNTVVDDIKKLGAKFDFFEEAKAIDKYLKDASISMKAPQYIAEVFDELEYPKSSWKPVKDELVLFFKNLPDNFKKRITTEILVKHIPKDSWGDFKKDWARASFIAELPAEFPTITRVNANGDIVVSVFLGDITEKLGIRKSEVNSYLYNTVYDAVGEAVNPKQILANMRPTKKMTARVLDYPNASCLENASVQVSFKGARDEAQAKRVVLQSLKRMGLTVN
jgi:hypothetical protein